MTPKSIEQKLQRAIRLHRERRLDEAEVIYREVLRAAPGNTEALHMCGLVAHQRGRHREAASLIAIAIAADPSDPLKHNNCGEAYRALGELTQAAGHFRHAIELNPGFAEAHLNYGLVMWGLGRPPQAKTYFKNVLALRDDSPKAHFFLGRIYLDEDETEQAIRSFHEALALNPAYAEAHYQLGGALAKLGRTRDALDAYLAAIGSAADHVGAHYQAACIEFELAREADAVAHLGTAIALQPDLGELAGRRALTARLVPVDLWCPAHAGSYTRLARPQWLHLAQPQALPAQDSASFLMPKPFVLEIFLARVPRARVLPRDLLVLTDDHGLLIDGLVNFPQNYLVREGGHIRHHADDGRVLLTLPGRTIAIDAPCVWLGGADNHFQWVFGSLARLWSLHQQPALGRMPLVVQSGLTRWQSEMLDLLGYGRERRIEVPPDAMLECSELHVASLVSREFFIAPVAIQHLRRELMQRVAPAAAGPKRIYLSRRKLASRRLANEAELQPLLARHGFETMYAEELGVAGQLTLFQSADVILGVAGAALANLLIAPVHAKVGVVVARGHSRPYHYYISAPLGQELTYLMAEPDYASNRVMAECDMTLAPELLQAFLAKL